MRLHFEKEKKNRSKVLLFIHKIILAYSEFYVIHLKEPQMFVNFLDSPLRPPMSTHCELLRRKYARNTKRVHETFFLR